MGLFTPRTGSQKKMNKRTYTEKKAKQIALHY